MWRKTMRMRELMTDAGENELEKYEEKGDASKK